ncbi:DUF6412 domain-containing protein [Subtercola sp. YIM 133946]|uniref:DUF6412 domain-containing protein n=1 Tax=Subtercola sp. YIM 133946 TaxID=3118909 RepID=UPI002F95BF00
MSELAEMLLRFLLDTVDVVFGSVAGSLTLPLALTTLALALLTAATLAVIVVARVNPPLGTSALRRSDARQNADLPVLVSQSNPDAAGHARARAPGALAPRA